MALVRPLKVKRSLLLHHAGKALALENFPPPGNPLAAGRACHLRSKHATNSWSYHPPCTRQAIWLLRNIPSPCTRSVQLIRCGDGADLLFRGDFCSSLLFSQRGPESSSPGYPACLRRLGLTSDGIRWIPGPSPSDISHLLTAWPFSIGVAFQTLTRNTRFTGDVLELALRRLGGGGIVRQSEVTFGIIGMVIRTPSFVFHFFSGAF